MLKSHFIKFYSYGHAESSHLNSCKVDSIRAGRALEWAWNAHSLGPSTAQLSHSTDSPKVLVTPAPQDKQVQECLPITFLEFYHQHWRLIVKRGPCCTQKEMGIFLAFKESKQQIQTWGQWQQARVWWLLSDRYKQSPFTARGREKVGAGSGVGGRCSGGFFACPGLWGLRVALFSPHNMVRWRLLAHLRDHRGDSERLSHLMKPCWWYTRLPVVTPAWSPGRMGRPPEGSGTTREEGASREEGTKRTKIQRVNIVWQKG